MICIPNYCCPPLCFLDTGWLLVRMSKITCLNTSINFDYKLLPSTQNALIYYRMSIVRLLRSSQRGLFQSIQHVRPSSISSLEEDDKLGFSDMVLKFSEKVRQNKFDTTL